MPTLLPTTFDKWQSSAEKSQTHNLKVVGSNPTPPRNNYINKIHDLEDPQRLRFLVFFNLKINKYKIGKTNSAVAKMFIS